MIWLLTLISLLFYPTYIAAQCVGGSHATLPITVDFETSESYASDVCVDGGDGTHTFLATGGWNGGGAARFDISSTADTYQGLTMQGWSTQIMHVRWVMYIPTSYSEHLASVAEPKVLIPNRAAPYNTTDYRAIHWHKSSTGSEIDVMQSEHNNTDFNYPSCSGDGPQLYLSTDVAPNFDLLDYEGQWVCFELKLDIRSTTAADERIRVWVTTRDGTWNETAILSPRCGPYGVDTGNWTRLDILGHYGGGGNASYFILDDVKVDNSYIGPPTGFLGSEARTAEGVTMSGASLY